MGNKLLDKQLYQNAKLGIGGLTMPNHCNNYITIKGEDKEVIRFLVTITNDVPEGEQFAIMNNLYPCPKELELDMSPFRGSDKESELKELYERNEAKYGYKDWYDWNIANWGSKWGDYTGRINWNGKVDDHYEVRLSFTTAWSPITEGITHISSQFPTLQFLYTFEEGGMGFIGGVAIQNGEQLTDLATDYPYVTDCDDDGFLDTDKQEEQIDAVINDINKQLQGAFSG